jgi:hypothetical protein
VPSGRFGMATLRLYIPLPEIYACPDTSLFPPPRPEALCQVLLLSTTYLEAKPFLLARQFKPDQVEEMPLRSPRAASR